ncbi:MAG: dihydrofolate reductase [bacterium]
MMNRQSVGFNIVVAMDAERGIGVKGQLPWNLPGDMAYFRSLTLATHVPAAKNAVVMGRRTWESIPSRFRPLPGRHNVVLTRQKDYQAKDACVEMSFEAALLQLEAARERFEIDRIFVIGGGAVYQQALESEKCQKIYVTYVEKTYDCDCFFPKIPEDFSRLHRSGAHEDQGIGYEFQVFGR